MNTDITKISKKLEKPLEVLGLALILTAVQVAFYHIVMSDRFVNYYINIYQNVLVKIDIVYRGYIKLLEVIFGPSYTTILFNFYEKIFILIFLVNLGYFAISRYTSDKNKSD
jgi:hypothetical protein